MGVPGNSGKFQAEGTQLQRMCCTLALHDEESLIWNKSNVRGDEGRGELNDEDDEEGT
jgi:hypothetical protein